MGEGAQITCVALGIGGWERLNTPERIRARAEAARRVGRIGHRWAEAMLAAGPTLVFVHRAEPAAATVTLVDALRRHGAGRPGTRVSVTGGSAGPRSGAEAVAEAVRLLARAGESEVPVTILLSDLLHWHVARAASSPPPFQRVRGTAFGPDHWTWPADGATAETPGGRRVPVLWRRACGLMHRGDHAAAMGVLADLLAVRPGPEPLLALGRCHLELGRRRAALETCRYLLRRYPLTPDAYPLMDLEEQDDVARGFLTAGLRIVRARPALAAEPERLEHDLLLALAARAYRRGERRDGDRLVNEAAQAYPVGGAPLRVLAVEALRRGDREGARGLLAAALARTSGTSRTCVP